MWDGQLQFEAPYPGRGIVASFIFNNGIFDAATERAVETFQCQSNIVCTGTPLTTGNGTVGPRTRAALGM